MASGSAQEAGAGQRWLRTYTFRPAPARRPCVQQALDAVAGQLLLLDTRRNLAEGAALPMSKNARLLDRMTMIAVTYGYARVSKTDDDSKNLETQLRELTAHGIRRELIFTDTASGRTMDRIGWKVLMARVQPGDTIVVAFLDRFSRNFEEGVAIQADLTSVLYLKYVGKSGPRWAGFGQRSWSIPRAWGLRW